MLITQNRPNTLLFGWNFKKKPNIKSNELVTDSYLSATHPTKPSPSSASSSYEILDHSLHPSRQNLPLPPHSINGSLIENSTGSVVNSAMLRGQTASFFKASTKQMRSPLPLFPNASEGQLDRQFQQSTSNEGLKRSSASLNDTAKPHHSYPKRQRPTLFNFRLRRLSTPSRGPYLSPSLSRSQSSNLSIPSPMSSSSSLDEPTPEHMSAAQILSNPFNKNSKPSLNTSEASSRTLNWLSSLGGRSKTL